MTQFLVYYLHNSKAYFFCKTTITLHVDKPFASLNTWSIKWSTSFTRIASKTTCPTGQVGKLFTCPTTHLTCPGQSGKR